MGIYDKNITTNKTVSRKWSKPCQNQNQQVGYAPPTLEVLTVLGRAKQVVSGISRTVAHAVKVLLIGTVKSITPSQKIGRKLNEKPANKTDVIL